MKICFAGPASSAHIIKWCRWFADQGHEVSVISFTKGTIPQVRVYVIPNHIDVKGNDFGKIRYLFSRNVIRKILRKENPDIISVHYATSYGTAVALSGARGYTLSVWGSDVYDFPNRGILHVMMLKYSLSKAQYIFSTSRAMAKEIKKYTSKKILITPFGVDTSLFSPEKRMRKRGIEKDFIVGTVKAIESKYGIDYLLKAAAIIKNENPEIPIKVRISGDGNKLDEYRKLADCLGIQSIIKWLGYISQEEAAVEWANMDIAVIPSVLESFGVSAVEAESCGVPVIIANSPGLMEATKPGETSIVVERRNERALADAIKELYYAPAKRKEMGIAGRRYVLKEYSIEKCFHKVESIFTKIMDVSLGIEK